MKVAIVHDWISCMGGSEKTVATIANLYPGAALFTLFKKDELIKELQMELSKVTVSFLQKLPRIHQLYRYCFPLFPLAMESFDLTPYDLIISSSHTAAKGVFRRLRRQLHVCYCHTPMRCIWGLPEEYSAHLGPMKNLLAFPFMRYFKKWDLSRLGEVDHFIANSKYIQNRINRSYGVSSNVIYPPVSVDEIPCNLKPRDDFYITVSRLVFHKRIDVIVRAFSQMPSKSLIIIGEGPELQKLQQKASRNVIFLGSRSKREVYDYLGKAKGFVFASEEDFGMAPVEAQAAGTPVIAYGKGGILETVVPNQTGIFFFELTPESLIQAIHRFEQASFNPGLIREQAEKFSESYFKEKLKQFIQQKWECFIEEREGNLISS